MSAVEMGKALKSGSGDNEEISLYEKKLVQVHLQFKNFGFFHNKLHGEHYSHIHTGSRNARRADGIQSTSAEAITRS